MRLIAICVLFVAPVACNRAVQINQDNVAIEVPRAYVVAGNVQVR